MPHELADLVALERARGVECRQLSERVARNEVGLEPGKVEDVVRADGAGDGGRRRELDEAALVGGLLGLLLAAVRGARVERSRGRAAADLVAGRVHGDDRLAERWPVHRDFVEHVDVLGALPREQRGHLGGPPAAGDQRGAAEGHALAGKRPRRVADVRLEVLDGALELLGHLLGVFRDKAQAGVARGNVGAHAVLFGGQRERAEQHLVLFGRLGTGAQRREDGLALGEQLAGGPGGDDDGAGRARGAVRVGVLGLGLLDNAVVVGAAKPERGDARAARHARLGHEPGAILGVDVDGRVRDGQVGLGVLAVVVQGGRLDAVDRLGQRLVLDGEDSLDQARHAGARLQVSDLGLDRRHGDLLRGRASVAEHVLKRGQLDLVALGRARAVALDVGDCGRVDAGLVVGAADRELLARDGGRVDARGLAVRGRCAALDDGVDRVAVAASGGDFFQHEHDAALADEHAARVFVVSVAGLFRREDGRFAERHVHAERVVGARGAEDHGLAVAVQQLVDGDLDGDEGARAGRVDDAVHAVHVEHVADGAGDDVAEEAWEGVEPPLREVRFVFVHDLRHVALGHAGLAQHLFDDGVVEPRVVLVRGLDAAADAEHAPDVFLLSVVRLDAGVLERLLDLEQRQSLVHVAVLHLEHVEPELARVKVEIRDKPGGAAGG